VDAHSDDNHSKCEKNDESNDISDCEHEASVKNEYSTNVDDGLSKTEEGEGEGAVVLRTTDGLDGPGMFRYSSAKSNSVHGSFSEKSECAYQALELQQRPLAGTWLWTSIDDERINNLLLCE
jgi:hypothetical protein